MNVYAQILDIVWGRRSFFGRERHLNLHKTHFHEGIRLWFRSLGDTSCITQTATGTHLASRRRRPTRIERQPDAGPRGPTHYDARHAGTVLDSREAVREAVGAGCGWQKARRPSSSSGCARAMAIMLLRITTIERACTGRRAAIDGRAPITQVLGGRSAQRGVRGAVTPPRVRARAAGAAAAAAGQARHHSVGASVGRGCPSNDVTGVRGCTLGQ